MTSFLLIFLTVLVLLSTLLGALMLVIYLMDEGHEGAALSFVLVGLSLLISAVIWASMQLQQPEKQQPERPLVEAQ